MNKNDKQAYVNHMATVKHSVLRMSSCAPVFQGAKVTAASLSLFFIS